MEREVAPMQNLLTDRDTNESLVSLFDKRERYDYNLFLPRMFPPLKER
jgi:hypothetical protein